MSDWPVGYRCAPGLTAQHGEYRIRPIHWDDREPIRRWRNEQIDVLRQAEPLSVEDQDRYYREVVRPQFDDPAPAQILVAVEESGTLIGYGGIVHIQWPDLRGEVSFLTDSSRLEDERFERDWRAFLAMLTSVARETLGFHKLTTETYETRISVISILESFGFTMEGRLRDHHRLSGRWIDSLAHGLLLP